jgi:hypothetical protein
MGYVGWVHISPMIPSLKILVLESHHSNFRCLTTAFPVNNSIPGRITKKLGLNCSQGKATGKKSAFLVLLRFGRHTLRSSPPAIHQHTCSRRASLKSCYIYIGLSDPHLSHPFLDLVCTALLPLQDFEVSHADSRRTEHRDLHGRETEASVTQCPM